MQEDEGFCTSEPTSFIQLNDRPSSIHYHFNRKLGPSIPQLQHHQQHPLPSIDQFRSNYTQPIIYRSKQYIVFNNYNNMVGTCEEQILFSASFPSSNLEIALKRKFLEYQLYLRPDTNTSSYFQWFYFKVQCARASKKVTFIIKNFVKSKMLYSEGLKPYFKSSRYPNSQYEQLKTAVTFYEQIDEGQFYNLKFSYSFESDGQEVEFCSQPPYTYDKLLKRLKPMDAQRMLCKSQLGKKVPYLIFNQKLQTKAVVIAIARQHPGEAVGSWIMDGFIQRVHQKQFQSILWYIIPMMNVDGVVLGNTRTGLSGFDYNRCWNIQELSKKQKILPEIAAVVELMKRIKKKYPKKMKLFLDFHGHSSEQNVFSYGPPCEANTQQYVLSRIFPELISKRNDNFNVGQCSYKIKADKKNTARGFMHNYFNIPYSYTIEGSFGIMKGINVGVKEFIQIGQDIAETINQFINKYLLKEQQSCEIINSIAFYKEKYSNHHVQVQEYDSENQDTNIHDNLIKKEENNKKGALILGHRNFQISNKEPKDVRLKLKSQSTIIQFNKHLNELSQIKVFVPPQEQFKNRYKRRAQRKTNQTQGSVQLQSKFILPKIKDSMIMNSRVSRKMRLDTQQDAIIKLQQSQKSRLKARDGKMGKKILILNSY